MDMDPVSFDRAIRAYIYYELPLFRMHKDWNRADNLFCIPASKSFDVQCHYGELLKSLKDEEFDSNLQLPSKYAALNTHSMSRLGTLEFRHMGGCNNPDKLSDWINILLRLKKSSLDDIDIRNAAAFWGPQLDLLDIRDSDIDEGEELLDKLIMWS